MIIIYHAECIDGWAAAYLFKKAYPDARLIPVKYGDELPLIPNAENEIVYIVDFSYPRDILIDLAARCQHLLVLDHHKTAQANCEGLTCCMFDMNRSGAMMAYDYLVQHNSNGILRLIIQYVQDYDLWQHKLPGTKEVNAYLRCVPMTEEAWDDLMQEEFEDIKQRGSAILKYQEQSIQQHLARAGFAVIDHTIVPTINCTDKSIISELLNRLCQGHPFAASYYYDEITRQIYYSLRSDENGVDVSEIAKKYGGGGHKHAAGFIQ